MIHSGTPPGVAAALVLLLGMLGGAGLALAVTSGISDPVDAELLSMIRSDAARAPLAPLRPVTEAGSTWAVTAIAVIVLAGMIVLRRPWMGLAAALTIAGSALLNTLAKTLVARARPELLEPIVVERGFSFPSGHSALGMVAWGIVAVLVARSRLPTAARALIGFALGALVALIGISRIYLGVHYPTDVLAGWVAGATVVAVFVLLTRDLRSAGWRAPNGVVAGEDREEPRSDPPATA